MFKWPWSKKKKEDDKSQEVDRGVSEIANKFLVLIDGVDCYEPVFKGIDSFTLGVCKLDYVGGKLQVYLRRPGLLIGKRGETIDNIRKTMGIDIELHEIVLSR